MGVVFAYLAEKVSPSYELVSPIGNLNVIQTVYASESTWSNYDLVTFYAKQYGVNVSLAHCIANAESAYQSGAVGDSGKAVGVYQFHHATWRGWRKKMGRSTKDTRFVAKDNIETAMFVMSKGGYKNWSPFNDGRCK
jgi:soluble lytic murein transglycosylase-like protein